METKLELPPELPEDEEILAKELKEEEEARSKVPLPIRVRRLRKEFAPRTKKRHRNSLTLYFRSLDKSEPADKDFQIELLTSSPAGEVKEENIRKMFDEAGKIRTPGTNEIVPESWLKIRELMGERVAVGKNLRDSLKFLGVTRVEGEEEEEEERAAKALSKKGKEDGETVQPSAKLDKPGKCSKEMQRKSSMKKTKKKKKKKGGSGKKKKKKSGKVMSKKQKKSMLKFLS